MMNEILITNKKLNAMGIYNLYDLLYFFPKGYDNQTNLKKISLLKDGEYSVIRGIVLSISTNFFHGKKKLIKAVVNDGTSSIELIWFNSAYISKVLKVGSEYYFIGTPKRNRILQIVNPQHKSISDVLKENDKGTNDIIPIYPVIKNISQKFLIKEIKGALIDLKNSIKENIPDEILLKEKLLPRYDALYNIHFPKNEKLLELSKKRLAFEELFLFQMGILSSKYLINSNKNYCFFDKREITKKFINSLSFSLTSSQKRVITNIFQEINQGKIVKRLIQGDVGSGKTIVSFILLVYMIENSFQGALMAPTEILALQHYNAYKDIFESLGIKVILLIGSLSFKEKKEIHLNIENGEIDLVIGTHTLIQNNIKFKSLGLIVIDEQHRFGVEQRKTIADKGIISNLIVMSATPIPRSLALSIYGDLDLSIIDELPSGRKPIETRLLKDKNSIEKMYNFINQRILLGEQCYFVAPLINESENNSLISLDELYNSLLHRFPNFNIEYIHGKMNSIDKEFIMKKFENNEINILVATTVIEVGINIPNATIMVIYSAEQFGLSSLHQLRGRIGRGNKSSFCFLIANTKNSDTINRLEIIENFNDGFIIAEEDLKLRKPGELFGTKQSGAIDFKFVDIIHDIHLIEHVKKVVSNYLSQNNGKIYNSTLISEINLKFIN